MHRLIGSEAFPLMKDLKLLDILALNEIEIERLIYSRISATYILRELFNSGLSMKRIALDGYQEDDFWGWRVPMRDPISYRVRFYRHKNLKQPFEIKYYQKKGVPLVPFYPFLEFAHWQEVMKNSSIPIIFTEGEKKASCLASFEKAAISIPGVWGWCSEDFKQDLSSFVLKNRTVFLLFDDDIKVKPSVRKALDEFSIFLHRAGARPKEMTI
ncbi:MAG: DUF3854 domain-containing protein [Candidatus Melainabacteria bacterium]|nr:DUF3854 domain-containing protein [Candidatus Melainabacteria bacterium]